MWSFDCVRVCECVCYGGWLLSERWLQVGEFTQGIEVISAGVDWMQDTWILLGQATFPFCSRCRFLHYTDTYILTVVLTSIYSFIQLKAVRLWWRLFCVFLFVTYLLCDKIHWTLSKLLVGKQSEIVLSTIILLCLSTFMLFYKSLTHCLALILFQNVF